MIVWLDLETSGLDPRRDSILEIAMIVTDDDLNQIGEPFVSLVKPLHTRGYEVMDDFVKEMHTKNGLLEQLYNIGALFHGEDPSSCLMPDLPRLGDIERAATEWLKARWVDDISKRQVPFDQREPFEKTMRGVPLGGNTVHFDKRFLIEHMDDFAKLSSHRIFDVSTMTEFAKRFAPGTYAQRPGLGPDGKPIPHHRALQDILSSIETAKFYRDRAPIINVQIYNEYLATYAIARSGGVVRDLPASTNEEVHVARAFGATDGNDAQMEGPALKVDVLEGIKEQFAKNEEERKAPGKVLPFNDEKTTP